MLLLHITYHSVNIKSLEPSWFAPGDVNSFDSRQPRSLAQEVEKVFQCVFGAFGHYFYPAVGQVFGVAGQAQLHGVLAGEGAVAHPLHPAGDEGDDAAFHINSLRQSASSIPAASRYDEYVRFRKRWLFLVLVLAAALPGYPPLIEWGLEQALAGVPVQVEWQHVSGYALTGLRFEKIKIAGQGFVAELDEARIGFNIAALAGRKLPLALELRSGRIRIEPNEFKFPAGPASGGGAKVEPVLQRLVIEDVQLESAAWSRFLLPPYRVEVGGRWPRLDWRLQTEQGSLQGRWTYLGGADWRTSFSGDVGVSRYWWDGEQYGMLKGSFGYEGGHWIGEADLEGGGVTLAGFPISGVAGHIRYRDHVITPELQGRALAGPVVASGVVDIPGREYSFKAEGLPKLEALLELWNVKLPATGEGPLFIEGGGWRKLRLRGGFKGEGRFLSRTLGYRGNFEFADGFSLHAEAHGSVLERSWDGVFDWKGKGYTATITDDKGSRIGLSGTDVRYQGQGRLVWPLPLRGAARVSFSGEKTRWRVQVKSTGVHMLLVRKPLDLSGKLAGSGMEVDGRLGPLEVDGRWDDLELRLKEVELLVGRIGGMGSWTDHFVAHLAYRSPYASLPLEVLQDGSEWRVVADGYGGGVWRDGRFDARISGLHVSALGGFDVSGTAVWTPERGWEGSQRLDGRYFAVRSHLEGKALVYVGSIETPLGGLPFSGTADPEGVRGILDAAHYEYTPDRLSLSGRVNLADTLRYEGDLARSGGRWSGRARLSTPWEEAFLTGKGVLDLLLRGYVDAAGQLAPKLLLKGVVRFPKVGEVALEPQPLMVVGDRVNIGEGELLIKPPFAFTLKVPWNGYGYDGVLAARGDIRAGALKIKSSLGSVRAAGPWSDMEVGGVVDIPRLGRAFLEGRFDLTKLRYRFKARFPEHDGGLEITGSGADVRWAGSLQGERLRLTGDARSVRLEADGFDSAPFGLAGVWKGRLTYDKGLSGDMLFSGRLGRWRMRGYGTLKLEGVGPGYRCDGYLNENRVFTRFTVSSDYASGEVVAEGAWHDIEARGEGVWHLPGLSERPWVFSARLADKSWRLGGPVSVRGRGLRYEGVLDWRDRFANKSVVLKGEFQGQGARLHADAMLSAADYRVDITLEYSDILRVYLSAPSASATLEGTRLRVAHWDLDPLGRALGADLSGTLAGTLDWGRRRGGSIAGSLSLGGRRLGALLRPRGTGWSLTVYDPELQAGLRALVDEQPVLEGVGAARGRLRFGRGISGHILYRGHGASLSLKGEAGGLRFGFRSGPWQARGYWQSDFASLTVDGPLQAYMTLDTASLSYKGRLHYRSGQADALLAISGKRAKWQGSGYALTYQGVPQAGPLTASGNGISWRLFWAAPLQLKIAGNGSRIDSWRLKGTAHTGGARRDIGWLRADLGYDGKGFDGEAEWNFSGAKVRVEGEGGQLVISGGGSGVSLRGKVDAEGALSLNLGGGGKTALFGWNVNANVRGTMLAPLIRAQLELEGRGGARVDAAFVYEREWRLNVHAPELDVHVTKSAINVDASGWDLQPFVGIPARVYAAGSGRWESLRLPLQIKGPYMDISGEWDGSRRALKLAGEALGGQIGVTWARDLFLLELDLPQPRVSGVISYREGRWSGGLDIDQNLAGGGVRGRLDPASASLVLEGYGQYSGALRVSWRPGRIEGGLKSPAAELSADLLKIGDGWVGRARIVADRWGGVLVVANGSGFQLKGLGPLAPLKGRLASRPWDIEWSYNGPLPEKLGELQAAGNWPGEAWIRGEWVISGHRMKVVGRGGSLHIANEGLRAILTASGPDVSLRGFRLGGAVINGWIRGPWRAPEFQLATLGLRLRGRAGLDTEIAISGWASGRVERIKGHWQGLVAIPGGELAATGEMLVPRFKGRWQDSDAWFDYPRVGLGGLSVDLVARRARGLVRIKDILLRGDGEKIRVQKPLWGGELVIESELQSGRIRVVPDGIGEGLLTFSPATGFRGTLVITRSPSGKIIIRGLKRALEASWLHPKSPWLPWGKGRLDITLEQSGSWVAHYGGGEVSLDAQGDPGRAHFDFNSPWGEGAFGYDNGWQGTARLKHWPVPALDAELELEASSAAGGMAIYGDLRGEAGRASFSVRADSSTWLPRVESAAFVIEEMRIERLPEVLNRLPYASGRVDATLSYSHGLWSGRLVSESLSVGNESYPVEAALYWSADLKTLELLLGQSHLEAGLREGKLDVRGELVRLPLHFLTGTWAGPPPGTAYWTGALRVIVPVRDPWSGYAVLVGERLDFAGEGKQLRGEAALRYEDRTLYIDTLELSGDGHIEGSGFWGPESADLQITIRDTLLTPILGVVPQWRTYKPRAEGTMKLQAHGRRVRFEARDLRFGIANVSGRLDTLMSQRNGEDITVSGSGSLDTPYPARFSILGRGPGNDLELEFTGAATLPLVGKLEGIKGRMRLPGMSLNVRAGGAHIEGQLKPLVLRLTGELPVSYPEYYLQSGTVRPDLLLTHAEEGFILSGEAEVVRAVLSRPEGKREVTFSERRYRYPLRFDKVHFFSNGGLLIREPFAQGEAEGEVYLGGSLSDPYLSGEVRGTRGEFVLGRHRFKVDRAWARFSPASALYPEIYLLAHAPVRTPDGEIELKIESQGHFVREGGRARLVLEPRIWVEVGGEVLPYSQEELLGLLALGGGSTVAEGVASLAIQNLLISQLEFELARVLGLDLFTVQTEVFTGGETSSTQFTVGKYLSPELFVSYSLDLGGRQVLGAEYRIDGLRLRVESTLGGDTLEPVVRFSMLYAIRPDLDFILKLRTGELRIGFEWRF